MDLVSFTPDAYKLLKKDLSINSSNYSSNEPWLNKYFEANNITVYTNATSISVGDFQLQYTGDETDNKNADDLQNVILLYSSFKGKLTPAQATDKYLWTALCHLHFREYIFNRWAKEDGNVNLSQRFFATDGRASLYYYNAIARLWWSGYLTYEDDKEKTDPWQLTRVLFSGQQIQKDLFDQPFSMNKTVVKGLLKALARIQQEQGNAATTIFRKCCDSYMNHYGAVTVLDFLDSSEIELIAYNYMKNQIDN